MLTNTTTFTLNYKEFLGMSPSLVIFTKVGRNILCTVHCRVHTKPYALCNTLQCTLTLYIVHLHCTLYTYIVHCTLTLYIVHLHCTLYTYIVHCTLTLYIVHLHCTLYTYIVHCTLTLYIVHLHCTLYTIGT